MLFQLSVLTSLSVLPFILVSLRLIRHSNLLYFLFFSENVFNPIIYICFQKHYRIYLIKMLTKSSRRLRGAEASF